MKKKVLSITLAVLAAVLGYYLPSRLQVTMTDSLSHRIFWQTESSEKTIYKEGDYVVFPYKSPWSEYEGYELFTKRIGCTPGDKLVVNDMKEFYCNDKLLGRALDADQSGDPLDHFKFNGTVPEGKYFTMGEVKLSYDSKYYGFIDASKFTHTLLPLY